MLYGFLIVEVSQVQGNHICLSLNKYLCARQGNPLTHFAKDCISFDLKCPTPKKTPQCQALFMVGLVSSMPDNKLL